MYLNLCEHFGKEDICRKCKKKQECYHAEELDTAQQKRLSSVDEILQSLMNLQAKVCEIRKEAYFECTTIQDDFRRSKLMIFANRLTDIEKSILDAISESIASQLTYK